MKIKQVIIGIKSLEQGLTEFADIIKAAQKGHFPKKKPSETYFVSLDAMLRVLTPMRLELLKIIREKEPQSVYELATLVHRDIKNIQHDIGLLNRLGLVSLSRSSSPRARVVPTVNYDQLHLHIPIV